MEMQNLFRYGRARNDLSWDQGIAVMQSKIALGLLALLQLNELEVYLTVRNCLTSPSKPPHNF